MGMISLRLSCVIGTCPIRQPSFSLEMAFPVRYPLRDVIVLSRCFSKAIHLDISAARHANLLFVKSKPGGDNDLAAYCKTEGIQHVLFEDFRDVLPAVQSVADGKKTIPEIIAK